MMKRRSLALILVAVYFSMGAGYRTPNFVVHAQTPEIAEQIGRWAEYYRREKAIQWLGQEMQPWAQPCPITVSVTMEPPSGATTFSFAQGHVYSQNMQIRGPLDRLIASVLPHEITHTVFAYYFRMPVPRWADEGGSVLSEDEIERRRNDQLVRQILNQGRQIRVRTLFSLKEYPRDVICLYAQGFSLADYLVSRSDRSTFLQFVGYGMQAGWDQAAQRYYGHRSVEELEGSWLQHLRDTKRQPGIQVAGNTRSPGTTVRLTVPPVQPLEPAPVVRGQAPSPDQFGQRFEDTRAFPVSRPNSGPYNLPVDQGWQPVPPLGSSSQGPGPVQLGPPQPDTTPMFQPAAGFPQR